MFGRVCIVVFLSLFVFFGCGDDDDHDGPDFYCPKCTENVTWNSYGRAVFKKFGNDEWGWKLKSDCNWNIHEGHEGGYGDTLQLSYCDDGVIFVWAWQEFRGIILSVGWAGQTVEGIKIGDSLDDFLYFYPDFYFDYETGNRVYYSHDDPDVTAIFEDDVLVELRIGRTY